MTAVASVQTVLHSRAGSRTVQLKQLTNRYAQLQATRARSFSKKKLRGLRYIEWPMLQVRTAHLTSTGCGKIKHPQKLIAIFFSNCPRRLCLGDVNIENSL